MSSLFYILFGEHYISSRDNNYLSLVLLDLLNCKVSHRVDRAQISMYFDSTMSINVIYNLNVDTVPHQLSQPNSDAQPLIGWGYIDVYKSYTHC